MRAHATQEPAPAFVTENNPKLQRRMCAVIDALDTSLGEDGMRHTGAKQFSEDNRMACCARRLFP